MKKEGSIVKKNREEEHRRFIQITKKKIFPISNINDLKISHFPIKILCDHIDLGPPLPFDYCHRHLRSAAARDEVRLNPRFFSGFSFLKYFCKYIFLFILHQ